MKRTHAAAFMTLFGLAACQSMGGGDTKMSMAGNWASADGIFVASFNSGHFTSRDTKTSKVLAEGRYTEASGGVQMDWVSSTTAQQHTATCSFTGGDQVTCSQVGAGPFVLTRA